ncbi:TPA: MobP1 family relaxase [Proteus mirabilis]
MGLDIEKEYRAKRARQESSRSVKSIKSAKSSFVHKVKNGGKFYDRNAQESRIKKGASKEVMTKITGSAKVKQGVRNSVDYISRDDSLELVDEQGIKINAEEAKQSLIDSDDALQLSDKSRRTPDITKNIVFSPPMTAKVKPEEAIEAVRQTLIKKYPDNRFVIAYHDDKKEHPHVHVILKTRKENEDKRIKITKQDLRDLRSGFCDELKLKVYDVKATHKQQIGLKSQLKDDSLTAPKRQKNVYEVIDFGRAPYQFNTKNKSQNYLTVKTLNKGVEATYWGKEFGALCNREKIQKGDLIKLKKIGTEDIKIPKLDDKGQQTGWKITQRNQWEMQNLGVKGVDRTKNILPENSGIKEIQQFQKQQTQFKQQAMELIKKEQQIKVGLKF